MPKTAKKILIVNDRGTVAGAGIATLRQMLSFVAMGHDVALAHASGFADEQPQDFADQFEFFPGNFLGRFQIPSVPHFTDQPKLGTLQDLAFMALEDILEHLSPDIVIFGNIHGGLWPVHWLKDTQSLGYKVVAYAHDLFYLTGRCAYPVDCTLYHTGCNATCPTQNEYPPCLPHLIEDMWHERNAVFAKTDGIPIFTNSHWTTAKVKERYPDNPNIQTVYLGLDTLAYAPQIQSIARQIFDIPEDRFTVLLAAWSFDYGPKGGAYLDDTIAATLALPNAHILLIGDISRDLSEFGDVTRITHLKHFPSKLMSIAFSAADVYAMLSKSEAFGQTALEAAASATPIIAAPAGGVVEVAQQDVNALHLADTSKDTIGATIDRLRTDKALRRKLGEQGRELATNVFSLKAQGLRWDTALHELFGL